MATQEEVLQKVGDYCSEKSYTLDDVFRSKFSEKFAAANAEANINDANVLDSIKFNLDTAFSATSRGIEANEKTWKAKEAEYLKKIESYEKTPKITPEKKQPEKPVAEIPDDVKKKLEELEKLQMEGQKREKRANVLKLAQTGIREDLHGKLEDVLNIMQLDYTKDEKDLAKQLNDNFNLLYKGSIGDIKPISPQTTNKRLNDFLASLPKSNVY
ncbi:MAG: hypothetical protein PHN55_09035 [Dysgonamonadaceae bacterium]|nr:hypothetical protein [Dysgonamonadaceae bacterium]